MKKFVDSYQANSSKHVASWIIGVMHKKELLEIQKDIEKLKEKQQLDWLANNY